MPQASNVQSKQEFDVFLCHNNIDKPAVIKIAEQLITRGIKPWLDMWELQPGLPWQRALEAEIEQIKAAAVFVGKDGIGPWQYMELDAFLREFVSRGCPVIPVLLEDALDKPQLPPFLRSMTWVDFREQNPDPMEQLIWGITGKKFISAQPSASSGQNVQAQVPAPMSLAGQIGLTSWQRRALEQKQIDFRKLWDIRNKKVQRIKEALAIETDVTTMVKYETQLTQEETALVSLSKELEDIGQALQ